ncbi:MAG: hypothetical protein AABX29_05995 [Nanoarchaeota archaeon]
MDKDNKGAEIKISDPVEAVRQKYDTLLTVIIIVLFIGFITLLITVLGLVVDSWNTKQVYSQLDKQTEIIQKLDDINKLIQSKKKI